MDTIRFIFALLFSVSAINIFYWGFHFVTKTSTPNKDVMSFYHKKIKWSYIAFAVSFISLLTIKAVAVG